MNTHQGEVIVSPTQSPSEVAVSPTLSPGVPLIDVPLSSSAPESVEQGAIE